MRLTDCWPSVCQHGSTEMERCRHCRGCKYLSDCGINACCNYYLMTDKRRPSKFGEPNCPVKKYVPGYKEPPGFAEWVAEVDAKVAEREAKRKEQEERRRREEMALSDGIVIVPSASNRKRGRPLTWDRDYAEALYIRGYYLFEIAEILDVPLLRVNDASQDHQWKSRKPAGVKFQRHGDLKKEKLAYQKYKAQKGNACL